jgi:FtsZ-interacting cell division protein ZipA
MSQNNNNILMLVGLLAVVALIIYICNVNNKEGEKYTRKTVEQKTPPTPKI